MSDPHADIGAILDTATEQAEAKRKHEEAEARNIVIMGGGNIGMYLAKMLNDQGRNTRIDVDSTLIGNEHIGNQLEEGRLALAISSHHTNCFTRVNLKADVL